MENVTTMLQTQYAKFTNLCNAISMSLVLLVARFAGAIDFWRSGQTKIDGDGFFKFNVFDVAEKKYFLFEKVYGIPEPFTKPMTQAATIGEFILPLLLVFGFTSRFAALGLLGMTAFIQFYVYPGDLIKPNGNWSTHLLWTAPLLLVLARGPGAFSLDHLLGKSSKTDA